MTRPAAGLDKTGAATEAAERDSLVALRSSTGVALMAATVLHPALNGRVSALKGF